jgi:hypothetical protein
MPNSVLFMADPFLLFSVDANVSHNYDNCFSNIYIILIQQHILYTNAGKQQS